MNLGAVIIKILGDTKGFEGALKGLGSVAGGALKLTTGLVRAGATAITGLGAIGLKYNSEMENYTTNFKVMLGSSEEAVKKVEELKVFAAKTPFEMSDLAEGTQKLLAFGIESDKTQGILKMLGDVSLGNGEKFATLTDVFAKVTSQGKLQGEELNRLIDAGFNPLKIISEQTGESMSDLKDEMSKGAISADMVADAFKLATSEGGQFYKGMEEASKTTSGLISTLKDNANSLIGEVFQPISESLLQEILPAALGYIDQLSMAFRENGVEGLVAAAGDIVADMVVRITEAAPMLVEGAVALMQSLIQGLRENISSISDSASEIIGSLVNGIIALLPDIITLGLELLISFISGIINALPSLIEAIPKIINAIVNTVGANLPRILATGVKLLLAIVQGIVQSIPQLLAVIPNLISSIVSGFANGIGKLVNVGADLIRGLWQGIKDKTKWLKDNIFSFARGITDSIKSFFGIASPSRVMRNQVGAMLGLGLGLGIKDSTKFVLDEIDKQAKAVSSSYNNGIDINGISIGDEVSYDRGNKVNISDSLLGASKNTEEFEDLFEDASKGLSIGDFNFNDRFSDYVSRFQTAISKGVNMFAKESGNVNLTTEARLYLDGNEITSYTSKSQAKTNDLYNFQRGVKGYG